MSFSMTKVMRPADIESPRTFGDYCQQELGIPYPSGNGLARLSSVAKTFFERNPRASWETMAKVVAFCKQRRMRPNNAHAVFEMTRYAFAAGVLPELIPSDRVDNDLEAEISEALKVESDPDWVRRLTSSFGAGRKEVLGAWKTVRAPSLASR